jgi:hypothetical protein
MSFTFGSDPEFMLESNGKIISAIGIVKGTKERRKIVGDYAFYYDNVLAEGCVPPASSRDEAVDNIGGFLQAFADLVRPCKLLAQASHTYAPDQVRDEAALVIGCSRESCVYSLEEIQPDESMFLKTNLRSAGGHIHLGSKLLKKGYNTLHSVRLLDLFLGIPVLYLDNDPTSKKRKELYGKAGRFRQPTYGVEYRSISNFWLSSPKLVELIYDLCGFVLDFIEQGEHNKLWKIDEEKLGSAEAWADPDFHPSQCHLCTGYDLKALRKCLDKGDRIAAAPFMEFITPYLGTDLVRRIEEESKRKYDLYKEWSINA